MIPVESPAAQRDRGLDRLRKLTIATAVGATGLAAVLSIVAASTTPGQASGRSANPSPLQGLGQDSSQGQSLGGDQQSQYPFAGIVSGGGGAPVAVSGGSHH